MKKVAFGLAALCALASGTALALHQPGEGRRTRPRDLALKIERYQTENGLTVLLAPDASADAVLVYMTFRAGAMYEPPQRSGMAHLVEHIMASGPTPETDYAALLEARRGRFFNAHTGAETMQSEIVVPPEELPAALWSQADRLGMIPPLIDDALVERNRKVVQQERAMRDLDTPYGVAHEELYRRMFAAPHPLHGMIIGLPAELSKTSAAEVKDFIADKLVPANAMLVVVGKFDRDEAKREIAAGVGALPAGHCSPVPSTPPLLHEVMDSVDERVSREPLVTMAWRLRAVSHEDAAALELGAQLLTFLTDGAWGMRLSANVQELENEAVFGVNLSVPYDETPRAVQQDLEGFMRQLTGREMSFELLQSANLALDLRALFDLDTLQGRAERMIRLEQLTRSKLDVAGDAANHWSYSPSAVREEARSLLTGPKVIFHARPAHPRPASLRPE